MKEAGRKAGKDRPGAKLAATTALAGAATAAVARSRAGSERCEPRLAGVIASIMDAVIALDERHEIVLVNPTAEKMFGYSEAQLLGKPISMLIPARYREAHDVHMRDFARTKVTNRGMGRFGQIAGLRADGTEFRADASIAQTEQAGERLYTVTLRDVTLRVEAEKALRRNYELLDRIFATTHFCIVYLDRDCNFVRVNQAYADAYGYAPEFFVGKNHFALYPGEEVEAIFRDAVATGEPFTTYTHPFEFPDHPEWGVTYWDWTLHPLKDENGRVEGLLFALLDVTQRKRAEEELHANERSLRMALTSVDVALFHQDRDLRYTWMYSPQLGYAPRDVIGKTDLELLPPEDARPVVALKRKVLETGVSARAEVSVTTPRRKYFFDLVVEPLLNSARESVGVTGASIDITARKCAELELQRKTALAQLLESLARTVSEAATPVEAMKICLARLRESGHWTLGRVAFTDRWGEDSELPDESVWQAADLARHGEFMRVSQGIRLSKETGQFIYVVLHDKKAVWLPDIAEAHGFVRRAAALADGLRAAFAFPVLVQGEVVAFLEFYADAPRPADPDLLAASETIAAQIAHLIERSRAMMRQEQLAVIVENSNDAIISCGLDRRILTWNAAAERLFGWTAQEAVGQPIDLIIPPERTGTLRRFIEGRARGARLSPVETVHLRKDGARIPTQVTFSPVTDPRGTVVGHSYTVRDMSELKRKEKELQSYAARLRQLSRRLREVEEAERRAISRELHDRIGQDLSTLGLIMGSLGAKLSQESLRAVHKQVEDMQGLIKSVVANVRDVMAELRPPVLDDYGLLAALRQLVMEFAQRTGIAAELSGVELQPRLPTVVETAMFRISQEALNNIAKHAQAKHVEICLHAAADKVMLDIADDGIGIDVNATPPDKQHWGLATMRERAEAVDIAFRLESTPGAGTRIVLEAERGAL